MALVYQALVDDSDAGPGRPFVLAGLVASAEAWAQFSDEWSQALKELPSIEYFKMKEAASRRGQFNGWCVTERDKKLQRLIPFVEKHALFEIGSLAGNDDYRSIFQAKLSWSMDYPYTLAFYEIIGSLFAVQDEMGLSSP